MPPFLPIEALDLPTQTYTGGKTGSARVEITATGEFVQFKPPIADGTLLRKIKAFGTDREIYGEYIASLMARTMFGPDAAPEVSLILDEKRQSVAIGSHYFKGREVMTLDDYMRKRELINPDVRKARHVSYVAGNPRFPEWQVAIYQNEETHMLMKQIARCLAISMVLGDHDVNPSNLLVIIDEDKPIRVVRIDFGHAFSDLINAPKIFGGEVRDKFNYIMDFLNRVNLGGKELRGRKIGSQSKIWRDYPGFIPSQYLVDAFRDLCEKYNTADQLFSLDGFEDILNRLDELKAEATVKHIYTSLLAINKSIGVVDCDEKDIAKLRESGGHKSACDFFATNFRAFCKRNITDMQEVIEPMSLQVAIDNFILKDLSGALDYKSDEYAAIVRRFYDLSDKDGTLQWVKTYESTDPIKYEQATAFKGSLVPYIEMRHQQLQRKYAKQLDKDGNISQEYNIRMSLSSDDSNSNRSPTEDLGSSSYDDPVDDARDPRSSSEKSNTGYDPTSEEHSSTASGRNHIDAHRDQYDNAREEARRKDLDQPPKPKSN